MTHEPEIASGSPAPEPEDLATITVRVAPETKAQIERLAREQLRSLNQQAVFLLKRGLEADGHLAA